VQGESTHPHYESVRPIQPAATSELPASNLTSTTSELPLVRAVDTPLFLSEHSQEPLSQTQQAHSSFSIEEIYTFLKESRNQLDTIFGQILNTDRERSSSASSSSQRSSSSSKRSREEEGGDEEDPESTASKRAMRRITLRNKTHSFVTNVTPGSSSAGTEISFMVRVDTPPAAPLLSQIPKQESAREGNKGAGADESINGMCSKVEEEEKAPDTMDKSLRGGMMKPRAKAA
jgi:hypothetical protein